MKYKFRLTRVSHILWVGTRGVCCTVISSYNDVGQRSYYNLARENLLWNVVFVETRKMNSRALNPFETHQMSVRPSLSSPTEPTSPSPSTPPTTFYEPSLTENHLTHNIIRSSNVLMHYSNHSPTISFSSCDCMCVWVSTKRGK